MKLGELLEGEDFGASDQNLLNEEVVDWTASSREVKKNSWFIAVPGELTDGHNFIQDAASRGARGVIVERPFAGAGIDLPQVIVPSTRHIVSLFASRWFDEPSRKLRLVGVTGTNGKTTTTFLIQHILNSVAPSGLIGTVEARWNDRSICTLNTTPGSRELNSILDQMVQGGIKNCAMEVSSHALKQGRVDEVRFDSVVFTNLSQDHLDYHKTFEDYFQSKSKLFLEFPDVARRVINLDDPYGSRLWNLISRETGISYAIHRSADYQASDIRLGLESTEFTLKVLVLGKDYKVKSKLLCLHNVYNLLAAIAVAAEMRYPMDKILEAVESFGGVPGRLERIPHPNGALIFVDYAHSPDAFLNIYSSLAPLKKGRLISVFGCGGNRDKGKRPQMGKIASHFSDQLIVTSDNPREENPKEIIREILSGIGEKKNSGAINVIEDRRAAICKALEIANGEDLVLILGKGHEDYQIIGKEKHKFSDQEEIKEWVRLRSTPHLLKN